MKQGGDELIAKDDGYLRFGDSEDMSFHYDGTNNCLTLEVGTATAYLKIGTSASPIAINSANHKFISAYVQNSAVSGDNRLAYLRLYLAGAGGGGEAARIYTTVKDVAAGTVHGAHISLSFATSGSVTGLAAAVRATLEIPDAALINGTYYGAISELYFAGASSSLAGVAAHAIHCFQNAGDTTGDDTAGYVFAFNNLSSTQIQNGTTESNYAKALKIKVDGTDYFIMLANAAG